MLIMFEGVNKMGKSKLSENKQVDFSKYSAREVAYLMAEAVSELKFRCNKLSSALSVVDSSVSKIYHDIESKTPTNTEKAKQYLSLQRDLRHRRVIKMDAAVIQTFNGTAIELNKTDAAMEKVVQKIDRLQDSVDDWYEDGKVPQFSRVYSRAYLNKEGGAED